MSGGRKGRHLPYSETSTAENVRMKTSMTESLQNSNKPELLMLSYQLKELSIGKLFNAFDIHNSIVPDYLDLYS